jgi:OmpA-OmpF porin, OOP family
MNITVKSICRVSTVVLVIAFASLTKSVAQKTVTSVPSGQQLEVNGNIIARDPDTFKLMTLDKSNVYSVLVTPSTTVKSNSKGVFRGGEKYEASYLLRGLRVQVVGLGNDNGELVANKIRFNEQDLKTAQALEARVEDTEVLAKMNQERITAGEENAKRMSGQIAENTALANRAQGTADSAMAEANRANNRINGLDEFDTIKTIVVPFATGSSTLGPKGRGIIDEAAAWVKTQDRKGWMVQVVGFADSTGKTAANKRLSERRTNSVIGYLVSKYDMPLHRLVQPFGAGVDDPAATNDTAEGRASNRRVEIKLLVNRGIAGK